MSMADTFSREIDHPPPLSTTSCLMTQQQLAQVTLIEGAEAKEPMNKSILADYLQMTKGEDTSSGKTHTHNNGKSLSDK